MERPNLSRWVEKVKSSFQPAQPSEDLSEILEDIRTGITEKDSPYYCILPTGHLNMETYRSKNGVESGFYDVETKYTKFIYPFTRSAEGELKVNTPILLSKKRRSRR